MNHDPDAYTSLAQTLSELIEQPIAALEPIAAGRNSRVFCVTAENGIRYAAKQYLTSGQRNGIEVEFAALQFLNARGIEQVPRAIAVDRQQRIAVYSYVDGSPMHGPITQDDLDTAVFFVRLLDELSRSETGWHTPAAEACFTLQDVVESIFARLARLGCQEVEGAVYRDLYAFIEDDLAPLLDTLIPWGTDLLARHGLELTSEISPDERILSPSDFGFHNALRTPDDAVVFLDFEFFGWDDIAKLTSDFLLHPAMNLRPDDRQRFADRLRAELRGGPALAKRLPVAYSLFAVKWCVILLNEFVPEYLARRRFAGETRDKDEVLFEQLAKAKRLCKRTADTYKDFPYGD